MSTIQRIQHSIGMVRITCLVHRDYADVVLHRLGELKSIQFTELGDTSEVADLELVPAEPNPQMDHWASLLSRINALISTLKVRDGVEDRTEVRLGSLPSLVERMEKRAIEIEESVQRIQAEITSLQGGSRKDLPRRMLKVKNLQIRLHEIAMEAGPELLAFSEILEAERVVEDVKLRMLRTEDAILFQGWVPVDKLEETIATIKMTSKGYGYILKVERPEEAQQGSETAKPPTLLRYQSLTSVFEIFASLGRAFGLPNYYEIDPTLFFLASFPFIFGMMYGDIGHGILLLASATVLLRMKSRLKLRPGSILNYAVAGSPLLMLCAVSSIAFGFLYGEVFGSEEWFKRLTGLTGPPWFSPIRNPNTLLRYSIYVGIVQISLGLLFDLLNKLLARRYRDALSGPIVWLWLYWSGSYLVVKYGFKVFDLIFDSSILALFIAPPFTAMVILKLWQHGPMGLNESFEAFLVSFSHSVSYARILALKMVSSSFSALLLPTSLLGFIPFALGTVALILVFETLLAFLHTLRLHWIEWFSKFYQGTGRPFRPFTITRLFTTYAPG